MAKQYRNGIYNVDGIYSGSHENKLLLAFRAANRPLHLEETTEWIPGGNTSNLQAPMTHLKKKQLIALIKVESGKSYYTLTEAGRALVHPKTGPLCRRYMVTEVRHASA